MDKWKERREIIEKISRESLFVSMDCMETRRTNHQTELFAHNLLRTTFMFILVSKSYKEIRFELQK